MSWVAAAVVGGAVIGGVASNQSAKKAANAAKSGADTSASTQLQMYDQNRADLMPWLQTGKSALQKLAALNGVSYGGMGAGEKTQENFDPKAYLRANPDVAADPYWSQRPYENYLLGEPYGGHEFAYINAPGSQTPGGDQPDYSSFYESPDYEFSLEQGLRATNAGLAARGLSNSGRAMKELTRFGQGLASQQLNNYRNSLAAMAGVGQTTGTNLAALGGQTAANVGNSYQNAADARASGYIATGNAVSGGINNAYGTYALMNMMNQPRAA
jgi:hypothetical protein